MEVCNEVRVHTHSHTRKTTRRAGPGRRYYTALPDENRRLRWELRLRDGAYRALGDAVADAVSASPPAAARGPGPEPGPQDPVGGPAWWGGGWQGPGRP
jgi:hypothetical protein